MKDRYNVSKLLTLFVTRAMDARLKQSEKPGATIVVTTPKPSFCKSSLLKETGLTPPPDFLARSTEMGSRALVHGLLSGEEACGQRLTNCHVQA